MHVPSSDLARPPVRLAIAGTGAWGINHVRAFSAEPGARVVAIAEPDPVARGRALAIAPSARAVSDLAELLTDDDIDAIVLATPAAGHAVQARAALRSGKHVLVEKPMALTLADAEAVRRTAAVSGRCLMVGHLMVYHPAIRQLRDLIVGGTIGEIYYLYSLRVNLGRLRLDENALWSFGPHDVSVLLHLLGELPVAVSARGHAFLQPGIEDVVFLHLDFAGGKMAHVQMSWLDPRKERRLTVVGSRRMVEFDDVHPTAKLRIYDKGYDRPPSFTQFGEYLTLRHGDVHLPPVDGGEPLAIECRHFLDAIAGTAPVLSGPDEGLEVVRVLDAAQRSLDAGGATIPLGA